MGVEWGGWDWGEGYDPLSEFTHQSSSRQSVGLTTAELQSPSLPDSPLLLALLLSTAVFSAQLLAVIIPQVNLSGPLSSLGRLRTGELPMLENHDMCGITKGGQVYFQLLFPPLLAV